MQTTMKWAMLPVLAVALAACSDLGGDPLAPIPGPVFSSGVSGGGVTPRLVAGNIPGSGEAVCADARVNAGGEQWFGFKVDPAASGAQAGVTYNVSGSSNQFLSWSAAGNVLVEAVVMKGGPNTYVYDYNPPARSSDAGLHSPPVGGRNANTPAVGHFVVCYTIVEETEQGCGPGFWKNPALSNGAWAAAGYATSQAVSTVFTLGTGIDGLGDTSMLAALDLGGGSGILGGAQILLRAAAAAVLNAAHADVAYALTEAQVKAQVSAALQRQAGETDAAWRARMIALATLLEAHNSAGCPL